jgi:hypothetical protein
MARDPRTYITLHDGMPEHHKVEALSDKAFRALIDLWCWCSRNLTDGIVPESVWIKRTSPKVRDELVPALADPRPDGGVYMHDYLEHQRSRAEVQQLREKRARAGSLGGKRSAESRAHDKWIDSNGEANA